LTDQLAYWFLAIAGIWLIAKVVNDASRSGRPELYCPNCGTTARSKQVTRGSAGIEIVLWLCFILPGLIYTLWRSSFKLEVCPACGEHGLIPAAAPRAQTESAARKRSN
jgi:predicted RNA-binding Zn-ribbon protein involved in translation (DUF1610 family)